MNEMNDNSQAKVELINNFRIAGGVVSFVLSTLFLLYMLNEMSVKIFVGSMLSVVIIQLIIVTKLSIDFKNSQKSEKNRTG
jgi:hypothetical protein